MNAKQERSSRGSASSGGTSAWKKILLPIWPLIWVFQAFYKHFLSYVTGRILRDEDRIYSIRFVWYNDSVYLHPMIWGSLLCGLAAKYQWLGSGWLLLIWFALLLICFLTIMYNFDVIKASVLALAMAAFMGLAYFSTMEFELNPLRALATHIKELNASVTTGFYTIAAYVFSILIFFEIAWAWLFHRVEIDESYVYEHRFMRGTAREPIFARGLKRETKDSSISTR